VGDTRSILAKLRRPYSAWGDAAVLLILFGGVNFLLNPARPGWFEVQPNPYLLIPVLMGGRYGSAPGLYSAGAVVALLIAFARYADPGIDLGLFLRGHSVLFLSFFVFGLVSGEVQSFFRRKAARLELLLEHSSEKRKGLDHDIRNIARVNRELQERLLVSDNRTFAMDLEIRALYECRPEEVWQKALLVLNRTEEVACAAFYELPSQNIMKRKAVIGGDPRLAEELRLCDSGLVREALENGEMVILSDLLSPVQAEEEAFLFAKPLEAENAGQFGVLVVSRMPFLRFDPATLARINLTVDWVGEIMDLRLSAGEEHQVIQGVENKKILSVPHFRKMLSLSVSAWRELRVPSGVICLRAEGSSREDFLDKVNQRVRTGDFLCRLEDAGPHAIVLLPFTSGRGADVFVQSCREKLGESLPEAAVVVESLPNDLLGSESAVWEELQRRIHGSSA